MGLRRHRLFARQEYWIERESAPITSNARLGSVLPCPDTLVIRDDEAFDAIAVGLGRFGIRRPGWGNCRRNSVARCSTPTGFSRE